MTQIFNVVVRTAGDGYDCGCRGSTRNDDDAEDIQRFGNENFKIFDFLLKMFSQVAFSGQHGKG